MLNFLLIVTSEGHIKFSHYFFYIPHEKRPSIESRISELCLHQDRNACHFIEDEEQMVIFRWFGSCLFIITTDLLENELLAYEFLNLFVSILNIYLGKFSEKHILFNVDRFHMVLEELVVNGEIVESSFKNVLGPILMLDMLSSR